MKPIIFKLLHLICLILWLQSCSVSPYRYLQNYTNGKEPYPLDLKMGTELLNLREDIYRETTSVESTSITAVNGTERVDVSYHPMGFHICKGVFLDIHENLSVNIADLFDIDEKQNYQILEETPSIFSVQKYLILKKGNEIERIHERLIGSCIDKIEVEDDKISIDECGLLSSIQAIAIAPDTITFKYQLINLFPPTITKTGDSCYKIKSGLGSDMIDQVDENQILFKKYLKINRLTDRIEFDYHFYRHPLYLIWDNDGLLFQNGSNQLVRIVKRNKNTVEVYRDDKLAKTLTLKILTD